MELQISSFTTHLCKWWLVLVGRGRRRKGRGFLLSVLHIPGSGAVAFVLTPWFLPSVVPGALGKAPKDPQMDPALLGQGVSGPAMDLCEFAVEERKTLINLGNTPGMFNPKGGEGIGAAIYLF